MEDCAEVKTGQELPALQYGCLTRGLIVSNEAAGAGCLTLIVLAAIFTAAPLRDSVAADRGSGRRGARHGIEW